MSDNQSSYLLYVHGMHCQACVVLTEEELRDHPKVGSAKAALGNKSVTIVGNFDNAPIEVVAAELSPLLEPHGYRLSPEPEQKLIDLKEFYLAVPIAIAFIFVFVLLQKLGIINVVNASSVTYGTAFTVGIVASLSTCMAVVGGLLLSMSATFAKSGDKTRPQLLFHAGRLVSFFVFGGVIGLVGSAFQLGQVGTFILGLLVGLVMLLLGINLLDVFHFTKRLMPAMPAFISKRALRISEYNHTLTPALVGIVTFFLPCGFTQAMQIYTLSTGSFLRGALTMLTFALGTLPVLALISFSSLSVRDSKYAGVFFKTAGLIVILFAVYNMLNSFVVLGIIPPLFNL